MVRFELTTPCLQGKCNNHYATSAHFFYDFLCFTVFYVVKYQKAPYFYIFKFCEKNKQKVLLCVLKINKTKNNK